MAEPSSADAIFDDAEEASSTPPARGAQTADALELLLSSGRNHTAAAAADADDDAHSVCFSDFDDGASLEIDTISNAGDEEEADSRALKQRQQPQQPQPQQQSARPKQVVQSPPSGGASSHRARSSSAARSKPVARSNSARRPHPSAPVVAGSGYGTAAYTPAGSPSHSASPAAASGRSRDVVRINLAKCFPQMDAVERERLVGQSLKDIGKSLTESACAWIWPAQRSIDLVREVEGLDVLKDALASGKGVVGITSHLGNWEVLNHFYCSQCKPIIFYRPPKLKAVDELLRKQRVQLGNKVAASTKEGILSVIKEVRKGGAVGIPADPEPAESAGIFVPFFATQALTSKFVPNMLAGGKAVGVFLHALRLPDGSGYKVILEAAPEAMYSTDTAESCAAMSKVVERYVAAYPSQYMWSMKRFKKRPPGEARWY